MGASPAEDGDVAALLEELKGSGGGDGKSLQRLVPLVYDELRDIAKLHLRRKWRNHMLQTTSLVNEAYIRLAGQKNTRWQNRAQFLAIASRLIRRVLVDHARSQMAAKRGGDACRVRVGNENLILDPRRPAFDLLEIHEALGRLEAMDPQLGRLVDYRFFGGLTLEETAEALGVSVATVKREWQVARAWLHRELG